MSSIIDTPARRIKVYRNGDIYHAGKKMIVPYHTRNFEQFLSECSQDVNLVNGGVRRLFNVHGKRIKSLDDILDSESYVATGGEPFKNVDYLLQEENIPPVFKGYSRSNLPILRDNSTISTTSQQLVRRKVNRSNGGLLIDEPKFPPPTSGMFNATTKAFKVVVFENGEANNEGIRLILNHRNCKTFEQLLKFLSSLKLLKSGQVRKIYDVKTGQKLKTLKDLVHGQNLALSSFDYFKKVNYKFIDVTTNTTQTKKEPDHVRVVRFFPNGDSYHLGLTVSITKKRFPTLTKLLDSLNTQIELVTGKIQKIYSLDGHRISTIDDLRPNGNVLVANDDPFIRTRYNVMAVMPQNEKPGLKGVTLHNDYISKIRPITQHKRQQRAKSTKSSEDQDTNGTRSRPRTMNRQIKSNLKKTAGAGSGMESESEREAVPKTSKRSVTINEEPQISQPPKQETVSQSSKQDGKTIEIKADVPKELSVADSGKPGTANQKTNPMAPSEPNIDSKEKPKKVNHGSNPSISPEPVHSRASSSGQTTTSPTTPQATTKSKSKSNINMNQPVSRPTSIPEDESIRHKTGREEEPLFEGSQIQTMKSQTNSKNNVNESGKKDGYHETMPPLPKKLVQTTSQSKIPKAASRSTSNDKL